MPPPYTEITAPMRAQEIDEALLDLETVFPELCTRTPFADVTSGNRIQSYVKIGSGGGTRPAVLVIGGVHAREWAPPDALVTFARNLLVAFKAGAGITFPPMTVRPLTGSPVSYKAWTIDAADVQKILKTVDLYLFPLVNPDGREYDLTHLSFPGWRKNRSPQAAGAIGVDLNRNFDIIWKFEDYYDVPVYSSAYVGLPASTNPADDTYRGATAHSERETKNVESLLNTLPINYFADVHMTGRNLLYSWGLEENGSDSTMTFQSAAFTGKRDGLRSGDPHLPVGRVDYKEFLPDIAPHRVASRAKSIADQMHDGILRAANGGTIPASGTPQRTHSEYAVGQSAFLYLPQKGGPTSGGSDDFACSRQFVLPNRQPIFAYTLETGHSEEQGFHCDYSPATGHFRKINREIHGALLELLKTAATSTQPKSGGPCLIATATMGDPAHPDVMVLRSLRDDRLRSTPRGARIADRIDRAYYSFSPAVARYLRHHPNARTAVRLGLVRPLGAVARMLTRRWR